MKKLIFFVLAMTLLACSKNNDPNPDDDGKEGVIWYPEKSQPGVFNVPDALKTHDDTYAKQTYNTINVLESLIAEYSAYFLVPKEHTRPVSGLGDRFEYMNDGHSVSYMYGDFVTSHRVFELAATTAAGGTMMRAGGDWWEDWDAEAGRPETGKHYGSIGYYIGEEEHSQTKEFNWKDDGGGNYRVELLVWSPQPDSYLTARYQYVFNADLSGSFTYWSYLPNGGGDYWRAVWESSGAGELTKGEGGHATQYKW